MVHVVRDDHKRACLAFDPGAGSEEGNLEMPPMRRLYFILLLDFGVLTKVKLEEAVGVQVYGAKTVELQLLMPLHQYVHLEALQVLSKLTTMSYSLTWRSSAFLSLSLSSWSLSFCHHK